MTKKVWMAGWVCNCRGELLSSQSGRHLMPFRKVSYRDFCRPVCNSGGGYNNLIVNNLRFNLASSVGYSQGLSCAASADSRHLRGCWETVDQVPNGAPSSRLFPVLSPKCPPSTFEGKSQTPSIHSPSTMRENPSSRVFTRPHLLSGMSWDSVVRMTGEARVT